MRKINNIEKIFRKIKKIAGFDPAQYRKTTLLRRMRYRMFKTGCKNYKQYLKYLDEHKEESEMFIESLSINVTDFFRDKKVFDAIRQIVIPSIVKTKQEKQSKNIRIWSIGCATGQEPYSIAILLKEALDGALDEFKIRIFATDMNRKLLDIARDGRYSKEDLMPIKNKLLIKKYFVKDGKKFTIKKNIRRMVIFMKRNIITEDIVKNCDIVLCRNLMIFFSSPLQKRVLKKIRKALAKDGYLLLGTAERAPDSFYPVCIKEHIYKLKK